MSFSHLQDSELTRHGLCKIRRRTRRPHTETCINPHNRFPIDGTTVSKNFAGMVERDSRVAQQSDNGLIQYVFRRRAQILLTVSGCVRPSEHARGKAESKKVTMMNRIVTTVAALFCGLAGAANANPLATVSVSSPATASVGDEFAVDVNISNVTDLYAWQLDLAFDPSVLAADPLGPTEGSFLSGAGPTFFIGGTVDNVGGTVSNNADTLEGPIPGATGGGTRYRQKHLSQLCRAALEKGGGSQAAPQPLLADVSSSHFIDPVDLRGSLAV